MNQNFKKEVDISIKSNQLLEDEKEVIELFTKGSFYRKNDSFYLSYDESEEDGFEGSKTTIKFDNDNKIIMSKTGTTAMHLVIQENQHSIGHYRTPYGDFIVGVNAASISSTVNDQGGKLFMDYHIDLNGMDLSQNQMDIQITPSLPFQGTQQNAGGTHD